MNRLLDVQERIQQTTAALGRLEPEFAKNPNSAALNANIRSLRKLYTNLTDDFESVSISLGLTICEYRLLEARPSVRSLSNSLATFQDALSVTFEALKKGPQERKAFSSETLSQTEFHVAYTFPGSFGVVLTVANQPLVQRDNWLRDLDGAVDKVFDLSRAKSPESILEFSKTLGRGPVKAIYEWAKANARSMTGTEIGWKRDVNVRNRILLQYPEFAELSSNIERTTGSTVVEIDEVGVLAGADIVSKRFHFVVESTDTDIRGHFAGAISESQQATLPSRYKAHFRKTTTYSMAFDEEKPDYFLMRLEPIDEDN
jgi:hypothetical protein